MLLSSRWIAIFRFHYFYLRNDPLLRNHSFVFNFWELLLVITCRARWVLHLQWIISWKVFLFFCSYNYYSSFCFHQLIHSLIFFVEADLSNWMGLSIRSNKLSGKKSWNFLNAVIPLGLVKCFFFLYCYFLWNFSLRFVKLLLSLNFTRKNTTM